MVLTDWVVFGLFFVLLIGIVIFAYFKVSNSGDFFVGGGKIPWWIAGVSHHISGYSGAVFVAFAGVMYTNGIQVYFWWALTIAIAISAGSFFIAPQWSKLRIKLNIQTPTEYIAKRYDITTQLIMAISGTLLKMLDMAAKWAAIAIILNGFTGLSLTYGILITGCATLLYITIGGLWADVLNDTAQFLVQFIVGITMIFVVSAKLGGFPEMIHSFSSLPASHVQPFHEPYTVIFAMIFLMINFLSYNGGTWHLAVRFIASPSGSEARKAALLSSALYLLWPIVLFTPLCLAPILIPELANPEHSYITLAKTFLPAGLVGLVLAGLFANTMAMTSTDSTTLTAVITRDILPRFNKKVSDYSPKQTLLMVRITTFCLTLSTIIVAMNVNKFGGVFGLIVSWFGALLGPIALPMILGFVPAFKRCGPKISIATILTGIATFALIKIFIPGQLGKALEIGMPLIVSFLVFISPLIINRNRPVTEKIKDFFTSLE